MKIGPPPLPNSLERYPPSQLADLKRTSKSVFGLFSGLRAVSQLNAARQLRKPRCHSAPRCRESSASLPTLV